MDRLAHRIVAEGLSVRSTEEVVALGGDQDKPRRRDLAPEIGARNSTTSRGSCRTTSRRGCTSPGPTTGQGHRDFASVEDLHRITDAMGLKKHQD
jgi:ParB family chromosome partitioning protein